MCDLSISNVRVSECSALFKDGKCSNRLLRYFGQFNSVLPSLCRFTFVLVDFIFLVDLHLFF